ncbi:hypothetical protein [Candidatus Electronema sp. JM]|uniref:hypothetical protein n=1 Tax=Candidatus Electronema sp. JM TaxID=3401571 RepID=UPI003AA94B01
MPDNPNNPNPPNNPHHVPTLADKQIDLSAFQLVDFDQEEIRNLPKPRTDFAEIARQTLALYPDFEAALKLTAADFDPDKVAEHLELADQLQPYSDWLERRAEQVRETRMAHLAEAYRPVLKLYQRIQAAAEFDPQVGYAFAFLADHFGAGKKKSKKE